MNCRSEAVNQADTDLFRLVIIGIFKKVVRPTRNKLLYYILLNVIITHVY